MSFKPEQSSVTSAGSPIAPEDINNSQHFFNAFGHMETEISAHYIVGLCQQLGAWKPFTKQQIEDYYRSKGHEDGFTFNALIEPVTERLADGRLHTVGGGFIIKKGETYEVTPDFIKRVYQSSPAITNESLK